MDFRQARARTAALNERIHQSVDKLYRMRRLQLFRGEADTVSAYVISLRKIPEVSFEERIAAFYAFLEAALLPEERLELKNRCFYIVGPGYEVLYCLEAYKKDANRIGFVENGEIRAELLHRMSCEVAVRLLKRQTHDFWTDRSAALSNVYSKMNSPVYMEAYPNPADRFVYLVSGTVRG